MIKKALEGFLQKLKSLCESRVFIERAKDVLIVALIISAAVLFVNSDLVDLKKDRTSSQNSADEQSQGVTSLEAAPVGGPYVIAVTGEDGSHCGLVFDGTELERVYDSLSPYLGEALGSAGEPEGMSEEQWKTALAAQSLYFDFCYPQPLSLVASSLGVELTGTAADHTARRVLIAVNNDRVYFCYQRERDGRFYRCQTEISASSLTSRIGDFPANNAAFLFETDYDFPLVDQYFLIVDGQPKLHTVTAQNPMGTSISAADVSAVFGINSYTANSYIESDGTSVYVDGSRVIQISAGGTLVYKDSEEIQAAEGDLQSALQAAQTIISATLARCGGIGRYSMTYLRFSQSDNSYTVRYDYEIGGYPVSLGEQCAAELVVAGGVVTSARINLREYSYAGDEEQPLPAVQAMAIVNNKGGGLPLLCYVDTLDTVTAGWAIVS